MATCIKLYQNNKVCLWTDLWISPKSSSTSSTSSNGCWVTRASTLPCPGSSDRSVNMVFNFWAPAWIMLSWSGRVLSEIKMLGCYAWVLIKMFKHMCVSFWTFNFDNLKGLGSHCKCSKSDSLLATRPNIYGINSCRGSKLILPWHQAKVTQSKWLGACRSSQRRLHPERASWAPPEEQDRASVDDKSRFMLRQPSRLIGEMQK